MVNFQLTFNFKPFCPSFLLKKFGSNSSSKTKFSSSFKIRLSFKLGFNLVFFNQNQNPQF